MLSMVLLVGCIAVGGLVFAAVAMVLGFLCMMYDHDAFHGREIGIMMFIAGMIGILAGGVFGIAMLAELQQQAIPAVQVGGGVWV